MRAIMRGLALIAVLAMAGPASAQTYPNKPVRIIVPFAAGGPTDVIARIVAAKLTDSLKQQVYVENLPGAGGNTGTATAAKASADGYTLLVVSTGFMVNPSLYARVPYDPIKDFQPLTLVAESPNVLFVHPSVPARSVKELIDLVKANPRQVQLCAALDRLDAASLGRTAQAQLQARHGHGAVHQRGARCQLDAGRSYADRVYGAAAGDREHPGRQGARTAVLAAQRPAALPDVPTMTEAGVRDQDSYTVTGLVMPTGAPKDIVERLHREFVAIGKLPDVKARLEMLGFNPVLNTPEEFNVRIKAEMVKWGKVVRDAGLRIE